MVILSLRIPRFLPVYTTHRNFFPTLWVAGSSSASYSVPTKPVISLRGVLLVLGPLLVKDHSQLPKNLAKGTGVALQLWLEHSSSFLGLCISFCGDGCCCNRNQRIAFPTQCMSTRPETTTSRRLKEVPPSQPPQPLNGGV